MNPYKSEGVMDLVKKWIFPVKQKYYLLIRSQIKKVEGRVPNPIIPEKDYSRIKSGDIASFTAVDDDFKSIPDFPEIKFIITGAKRYNTVEDMLDKEGLENVVPGANLENAIEIYNGFPGYPERIAQYGIYAIKLGDKISKIISF
jgi:ASC-1-like (ASCH) protein